MRRAPPSLRAKALAYLAQREHSRDELRRKLVACLRRQAEAAKRARGAGLGTAGREPRGAPGDRDLASTLPATVAAAKTGETGKTGKTRTTGSVARTGSVDLDDFNDVADGSDESGVANVSAPLPATQEPPASGDPPGEQPAADIEAVLDALVAQGLLSDARFVESRIHAREARFGNLRIRQELARHGVQADAAALGALQASELERARTVWAKRFGTLAVDAATRAKQMRFLAARGFSSDVVRRVTGGREDDD